MATIDELRALAREIREERQIGGNTGERVGNTFDKVADLLDSTGGDISDIREAVEQLLQDVGFIPRDISRTATDAVFTNSEGELLFWLRAATDTLAGLITAANNNKLIALPTAEELAQSLAAKQNRLTFDPRPIEGSTNPVTSDGINTAIANFVTRSVSDLIYYYTKSETYTKEEVNALVAAIKQFVPVVAQTLPTPSADTMYKLYLIPSEDPQESNIKDEYITIDNGVSANPRYTWEKIGSVDIDISGKADIGTVPADVTRTQTDATFVNSDNETLFYLRQASDSLAGLMTAAEHNKLDALPTAQDLNTSLDSIIYDVSAKNPTAGPNNDGKFTLAYILNPSNVNTLIPTAYRKGGMSIKFVLSSDNKYVQHRLMHPLDNASTAASDFANTANWQGVDDEPTTGSHNLVESGGVKGAIIKSEQETFELFEKVKSVFSENEENTFYITDHSGFVVAKVNVQGLQVTRINSNVAISQLDRKVICDKEGYIIASLNKEGLATTTLSVNSIKDNQGNIFKKFYSNYELFSIGDSLSTSGKWQAEVAKQLGLIFDNSKNILSGHQLSTGGTTTGGEGFDNAVWRTKNLIDGDYIQDDGENTVIIIECINDVVSVGTDGTFDDSVKSIIPTDPIEGYSYSNWGTSLLQSIPAADRKMNAVLALEQTTSGKNLAITNMPSSNGQICLRIYTSGAGTLDYYINVLTTDTLQDILDKILEINYTTVTDTLAQDNQSINFVGGNITVTFIDTDNTGMTASVTDTNTAKIKKAFYFIGDSVANDWEDTSKWLAGTDLTFSMGYKSVIEMIQREYPKAHIIIGMFPLHNTNPEDFLLPNGTYDTKAYSETTRTLWSNNLREQLQKIADFYCIPIIDVYGLCGIGISNYSTYYRNNNVHPKDTGYIKIGQTIASEIKRYI